MRVLALRFAPCFVFFKFFFFFLVQVKVGLYLEKVIFSIYRMNSINQTRGHWLWVACWGLRECLELNGISVTSALTPHMSTIDSFTLKRSLKLFSMRNYRVSLLGHPRHRSKWECLRAGDRKTDKNHKGRKGKKTKTDKQTNEKREKKSKRAIKKTENSLFQKQWVSCW